MVLDVTVLTAWGSKKGPARKLQFEDKQYLSTLYIDNIYLNMVGNTIPTYASMQIIVDVVINAANASWRFILKVSLYFFRPICRGSCLPFAWRLAYQWLRHPTTVPSQNSTPCASSRSIVQIFMKPWESREMRMNVSKFFRDMAKSVAKSLAAERPTKTSLRFFGSIMSYAPR